MASRDSGLPGGGQSAPAPRAPSTKSEASTSSPGGVSPDILMALQNAQLFKGFTETGLQILGSIVQQKQVPAGTPLFVENMIGEELFIVAEGSIRISVRGPKGQDITLAMLGPGESLGEAALLRAGPRLCSATAEAASVVIGISRRDIAVLQRTKPQACLKLMMGIVDVVGTKMREAQSEYRQYLAWRLGMG